MCGSVRPRCPDLTLVSRSCWCCCATLVATPCSMLRASMRCSPFSRPTRMMPETLRLWEQTMSSKLPQRLWIWGSAYFRKELTLQIP